MSLINSRTESILGDKLRIFQRNILNPFRGLTSSISHNFMVGERSER